MVRNVLPYFRHLDSISSFKAHPPISRRIDEIGMGKTELRTNTHPHARRNKIWKLNSKHAWRCSGLFFFLRGWDERKGRPQRGLLKTFLINVLRGTGECRFYASYPSRSLKKYDVSKEKFCLLQTVQCWYISNKSQPSKAGAIIIIGFIMTNMSFGFYFCKA